VLGTRIVPRGSAVVAVLGIALGSPLVVAGFVLASDPLVRAGAVLTLIGAGGLLLEVLRVTRARGRWTTDPGWHRMTGVGLIAGVAWFVTGIALAASRVLALGAVADAWSTALVVAPLVVGWVVGVLIASWTHLLPAIGPGGPAGHARRRQVLGRAALARIVAFNGGTALVAVGWPAGIAGVAVAGLGLAAVSVVASVALSLLAMRSAA
jgi:hypothetical protein